MNTNKKLDYLFSLKRDPFNLFFFEEIERVLMEDEDIPDFSDSETVVDYVKNIFRHYSKGFETGDLFDNPKNDYKKIKDSCKTKEEKDFVYDIHLAYGRIRDKLSDYIAVNLANYNMYLNTFIHYKAIMCLDELSNVSKENTGDLSNGLFDCMKFFMYDHFVKEEESRDKNIKLTDSQTLLYKRLKDIFEFAGEVFHYPDSWSYYDNTKKTLSIIKFQVDYILKDFLPMPHRQMLYFLLDTQNAVHSRSSTSEYFYKRDFFCDHIFESAFIVGKRFGEAKTLYSILVEREEEIREDYRKISDYLFDTLDNGSNRYRFIPFTNNKLNFESLKNKVESITSFVTPIINKWKRETHLICFADTTKNAEDIPFYI